MTTLFNVENSDSEEKLTINSGYANNYNSWRQKEELNKLKTKYGDHIKNLKDNEEESSETSSEEDEEGAELTEEVEKKFYNTLACLKNKDPKIYDERVTFFEDTKKNSSELNIKKEKEKKLFLRDYERRMVVERGGKFSDSDDEDAFRKKKRETRAPTYVEEQLALKASISKALNDEDDEDDDKIGRLLVPKIRTEEQKSKVDETYREWLKGQKTDIDSSEQEALKPLRDFWTDPKLEPNEKFLRDYVLNKKFMDKDEEEGNLDHEHVAHDSDVDLSEDEKNIEKQEEFEHKYNFRFEEPDQEFIKRYPRTMENSLRKKDTKRSTKRAEVKHRKEEDKIRKMEELKQLKAMKRKEIADKIAQLKEITGNDDMQFDNIDLDADFDPAEHDRKMQEIFNDDYYAYPEDMKPEFPDVDEELGIERTWDDYDPENEELVPDEFQAGTSHCDDPQFNMDADYDPTRAHQSELIESTRKKKKRRRSKFAEMIAEEKPKFDPNLHSSYRDYIEQYYALDYEDMIDDLPCRFKYRKVVPNDYGLSVEEILRADDRELQKWCSLKKALEHKPESIEMNEVRIYQQKARNEAYKKKILRSLYTPEEEPQDPETAISVVDRDNDDSGKKKRKKKKKKKSIGKSVESAEQKDLKVDSKSEDLVENSNIAEEKVAKSIEGEEMNDAQMETSIKQETITSEEFPTKKSKKRKGAKKANAGGEIVKLEVEEPQTKKLKIEHSTSTRRSFEDSPKIVEEKTKDSKTSNGEIQKYLENSNASNSKNSMSVKRANKKNKKKKLSLDTPKDKKLKKNFDKTKKKIDDVALLSSERLKAYGLNPKKFKNKLKYGKQK